MTLPAEPVEGAAVSTPSSMTWLDTVQFIAYEVEPVRRTSRTTVYPAPPSYNADCFAAALSRGLTASERGRAACETEPTDAELKPPYSQTAAVPISALSGADPAVFDVLMAQFAAIVNDRDRDPSHRAALAHSAAITRVKSSPAAVSTLRQHAPYQSVKHVQMVPRGLHVDDRIVAISYHVMFPVSLPDAPTPHAQPHVKLGGVWMDLGRVIIASLIQFITGVRVANIEMFMSNQGRCSLYLHNPRDEGAQIIATLDKRLWMGPEVALYATSPNSANVLASYVKALRFDRKSKHFPRHLLTAEEWVPKTMMKRNDGALN